MGAAAEARTRGLGKLAAAGKGILLGATPLGDIDFANEMRLKLQRGEPLTTMDKVLAASMAAPFIPAAIRKGGKETVELIRGLKGKDVDVKFPTSEFDAGVRLDLKPSAVAEGDLAEATTFMKRADDLFRAEEEMRKQGLPIRADILEVARQVDELAPALKGLNDAEAMNVIARARDSHRAGKLGGIDARIDGDALVIETTDTLPPALRRKGLGTKMYMGLIGAAANKGLKRVESDAIVSNDAAWVYNSLAERGINVERNPLAYNTGSHWVTEGRSGPVFRIEVDKPTMFGKGRDDLLTAPSPFEDIL